jgi:hypothetical protein
VFKKQLYELVCKEQSWREFLRGVSGVIVKDSVREEDIAVGSQWIEDLACATVCDNL